ncbi:hypothetical protein FQR65_LT17782 [Abscondita terminalis]|nr:hypothetical protein FQR65_LT17782 [Abscondita terminalis]
MDPGEDDDTTYKDLFKKFWISVGFTVPVFILAMGGMIPGNPISKVLSVEANAMDTVSTNYPCLGAGAAFILQSCCFNLPGYCFHIELKEHHWWPHLYFESVGVILTLVLLGQLMEAKAHSRTNSAIKELIKLSPTEATLVENGQDKKISVDHIQLEQEVLLLAASLNQNSTHPLAEAIINKAKEKGITTEQTSNFENISGKGVYGQTGGKEVLVGNDSLLKQYNIAIDNAIAEQIAAEQEQGKTVSFVTIDNNIAGYIAITDPIKATSREAVHQLMQMGVDVVMITGDIAKNSIKL